ncbi:MAG: proline dehydrogenase family protein, partial [Mariprofundaceae bacterium]|nr:proline dehydrogenase family protein [Mariprofundaceae bacterium]
MTGLMASLAEDDLLRVQLLRFIDVLPALKTDAELVEHIKAYFLDAGLLLPDILNREIKHADQWPAPHIVAPIVRESVEWIGHRFIAGHEPAEAERAIKRLIKQGMKTSLDLLGEAVLSEEEADAYQCRYLELIESLASKAKQLGPLHLSIKVSSLYS